MISGARNDICILNCFFSPAGFRTPLLSFNTVTAKLLESGAPLITVEAAFDNEPFQLSPQPGQTLIQLRAPARLWLKERLLNIALSHVPPQCDKVAWIDGDLLFERHDWIDEASQLLESHEIVQLFDTIHYLPPGAKCFEGISVRSHRSLLALATDDGSDAVRRMQRGLAPYAVPGGALAARREVLAAGLYDRSIVGGNDSVFLLATLGALDMLSLATPGLARDVRLWELAFASHRRTFTHRYVPGTVYHLWHGEREHRGYTTRNELLRSFEYDPSTDIALHENGCYRWSSPKLGLHEMTRQYFRSRLEDGTAEVPTAEFPSPTELPREARAVISELYQRLADSSDHISRLIGERDALDNEVTKLRHHAHATTEWAKELKEGNSWLQSQLALWQAHAHSPDEPASQSSKRSTLLVLSPDRESATAVLQALEPLPHVSLELTGCQTSTRSAETELVFKGTAVDCTGLESAELIVLTLNYMSIAAADLDRLAERLRTLAMPTVWSCVAEPLDWYCRTSMRSSHSTCAPFVDPAQFVATIEEQRRRSRKLHEALSTARGIKIANDGTALSDEARTSLRQLLGLPALPPRHERAEVRPRSKPENLDALLSYLDTIGASTLREEIVTPTEQSQLLLAPR